MVTSRTIEFAGAKRRRAAIVNRKSKIGNGFTLIELLVVIAIIALLAAILFPVFARARENARRATCQSNMKQMSLGIMQYTQDYDETFPRAGGHDVADNCDWGAGTLSWADASQPYTKSTQIYKCQSDTRGDNFTSSYGYNGQIAGELTAYVPSKLASINQSSKVVLWYEDGIYFGTPVPRCATILSQNDEIYFNPPNFRMDYNRHLGGLDLAFVDGHVKWYNGAMAPNVPWPPGASQDQPLGQDISMNPAY